MDNLFFGGQFSNPGYSVGLVDYRYFEAELCRKRQAIVFSGTGTGSKYPNPLGGRSEY